MAKKVTPELARIRGIPPGIDLRSPSRHPDILGGDDLLIKVEQMREATGYRLPVSVKLGAGRVSDDVKIAVKDGFDFIELDGMQGSTGAGSAEVIDYVGVPTLPAIIEAIDALEEIGRRQDIEIVLMGGIRDGVDAVKALCLGADAVAFGTSTIIAGGCIACMQCHIGQCVTGISDPGPRAREALRPGGGVAQHPSFPRGGALADRGAHPRPRAHRLPRSQPRRPCRAHPGSGRDHRPALRAGLEGEDAGAAGAVGLMAVYDINRILVPDAPPEYEDHTRDVHYVPAPCQVACPIGTDAPSYIAHIWDEDYEGAFEAITSTNPFSSICGRVCDAPCEPACRRVDSDGAVQIRNLKRFVMDKLGATYRPPAAPVTRSRSIGIVGAGPAGLVAAHDLCVAGYAVHVYEMTDRLGGMMIWGIPAFRLPPGIIDEDVDRLMQRCPGLEVHLDTALGRDVSLAELKERHGAVLLTIGAWWGKPMGIAGEDDERVVDGVGFLRRVNTGERPEMPETVVVVGGGDVAMDACRVAKRLPGCRHVKVIYRRGPGEIPAREIELHHAITEGAQGGRRVPLPHPAGCSDPARQPARAQMREDRARRA